MILQDIDTCSNVRKNQAVQEEKGMWNKVKRMMAGVMMAALLFSVSYGIIGTNDEYQISVCGEAPEPHNVVIQ
ncbi:MAG: hypothetical protein J1E01_09095 [Acetatifactor sp.]|nr:hypothetical protein [Acetatifactor sp.]